MGTLLAPKQVNSTRGTVEIHPYVQGRLRALPRQDETAGILLGTSDNGVTRVTGFKRVTPSALRQAAADAGPALAGFYRLQTANSPALLPEEEELWKAAQPGGHSLFLLVKSVDGGVEATAWTRDDGGPAVMETMSLDGEFVERRQVVNTDLPQARTARPAVLRRIVLFAAIGLVLVAGSIMLWPAKAAPLFSLEVQSRAGELTAIWEQQNAPERKPDLATLSILDGANEQTTDLTRNYTSRGRITVKPRSRDVVFTLRVQYAGAPLLSRSATYLGFVPAVEAAPVPAAAPAPATAVANEELDALRKRNKELEEAVAALRKHFLP